MNNYLVVLGFDLELSTSCCCKRKMHVISFHIFTFFFFFLCSFSSQCFHFFGIVFERPFIFSFLFSILKTLISVSSFIFCSFFYSSFSLQLVLKIAFYFSFLDGISFMSVRILVTIFKGVSPTTCIVFIPFQASLCCV